MGNMGISGLALAFSLAHWIIICMGLFLIRENLGKPEIGMIAEAFLKAMLGSVIAGSLSLMVYYVMIMAGNLFLESRIAISVSFFLVSFVYVGVYIIVSKLLKNNELYVIMTNLKKITHDKMKIQL
jgi:peptidoglycan biosynthesis protein MviN/MurJ (putative lipid II flippase)